MSASGKPEYGPFQLSAAFAYRVDDGDDSGYQVATVTYDFAPSHVPTPQEMLEAMEQVRETVAGQLGGKNLTALSRQDYFNHVLSERTGGTMERVYIPGGDDWSPVEGEESANG